VAAAWRRLTDIPPDRPGSKPPGHRNFFHRQFLRLECCGNRSGGNPVDYGVTNGYDGGVKVPNTGTLTVPTSTACGVMDLSQRWTFRQTARLISAAICGRLSRSGYLTIFLAGSSCSPRISSSGCLHAHQHRCAALAGPQVVDFEFTPGDGPMFFDNAQVTPLPLPLLCRQRHEFDASWNDLRHVNSSKLQGQIHHLKHVKHVAFIGRNSVFGRLPMPISLRWIPVFRPQVISDFCLLATDIHCLRAATDCER